MSQDYADDWADWYKKYFGEELLWYQKELIKIIMSNKKIQFNTRGRKY